MAPEQTVGGGLIDARTDIYAVGVVLFEMVSGDRPFQADDTLALLGMHRAAPIPRLADRVEPGVPLPPGLQEIVEKAMAKSPGDRYQSAIELAEAIDSIAVARDTGELPIRRSAEVRKSVGMAPTMLDISDSTELVAPPQQLRGRPRGSFLGSLVLLAILLGGVGAAVLWIKGRSTGGSKPAAATAPGSQPAPEPGSGAAPAPMVAAGGDPGARAGSDRPGEPPATGSNLSPAGSAAAAAAPVPEAVPGPDASEPPADARVVEIPVDSAPEPTNVADQGAAPGSATDIEMDPATAEDPAPASTKPAIDSDEDEAANAPRTTAEVEKHAPAAPVLATSLPGAIQLIKDGKRDLAQASLRALWNKTPNSSYIPFLLGNLYCDQHWWSVALDHYSAAIKKDANYRSNPTLNRNVIRMLASKKTSRKAEGFLKYTVGRPALPYVRYAAQHDANAQVKRLSGWLARNL
jgi:serine/threonine-protein kinase